MKFVSAKTTLEFWVFARKNMIIPRKPHAITALNKNRKVFDDELKSELGFT